MAIRIKKATEHAEINMTVRAYIEKIELGEITFDIDIQRAYVWKDVEQKSGLIQSLIINDIIPPFIFNKVDGILEGMDSKQRSFTINKYMHDEFALKGVIPIEVINEDGELEELDINGLKFTELPECCQNAIKEYNLSIWYLNDADQEQVSRNFCNLNSGKPINAATLNRIKAKSKEQIKRLGEHKIFKEALSKTALDGHVNEDLVIKAHAVLYADEPSTDTKWIRPYMRIADITEHEEKEIKDVLDRMVVIHGLIEDKKVSKRVYTRTHMISIIPVVAKSIKDERTDKQMMEWFVTFFCGKKSATTSKIYNSAAGAGSGKKDSVRKRLDEVEKSYNEYFANVEVLMR